MSIQLTIWSYIGGGYCKIKSFLNYTVFWISYISRWQIHDPPVSFRSWCLHSRLDEFPVVFPVVRICPFAVVLLTKLYSYAQEMCLRTSAILSWSHSSLSICLFRSSSFFMVLIDWAILTSGSFLAVLWRISCALMPLMDDLMRRLLGVMLMCLNRRSKFRWFRYFASLIMIFSTSLSRWRTSRPCWRKINPKRLDLVSRTSIV